MRRETRVSRVMTPSERLNEGDRTPRAKYDCLFGCKGVDTEIASVLL